MKTLSPVVYTCVLSVSCVYAQMNGGGNSITGAKWANTPQATLRTLLTGSVKIDDGSPLPGTARILLICGSTERTVARSNLLDDFGFQIGAPADAGTAGLGSAFSAFNNSNVDAASGTHSANQDMMSNCELRAELSGYISSTINLMNPSAFDGSGVGVIWLHRIGEDAGPQVSITTLTAPKEAKKEFEKGKELARQLKFADAANCFRKAVKIHPQFAEAWMNLGVVQYRMNAVEDAQNSEWKAREIDPKLPGIYQILGYIAADKPDWSTAVRYLEEAERLNPVSSALPWYVSAFAYYQLHQFDNAERSIRQEIKLDPQSQFRRAKYLLGLILAAQNDGYGAAHALRDYLAATPDPRDVAKAKAMLAGFDHPEDEIAGIKTSLPQ